MGPSAALLGMPIPQQKGLDTSRTTTCFFFIYIIRLQNSRRDAPKRMEYYRSMWNDAWEGRRQLSGKYS